MTRNNFRPGAVGALVTIWLAMVPVASAKLIATDEFEDGATRPVSVVVLPSQVSLANRS